MRVSFQMTGGFAPVFRGCELDTETLPADDAKTLESLVAAARLPEFPSRKVPNACDVPDYTLTITTPASEITRTFDMLSLPEEAKPLVAFLLDRSGDLLDRE